MVILGHETCQGGDIPQEAHTHLFVWLLNSVVLWGHVTD